MIVWKLDQVLRVKGVKGRELARRMAIGENYLSRVRHEVPDRLSLTLIDGLCRELGCSVADLLEYRPEEGESQPAPLPAVTKAPRAPKAPKPRAAAKAEPLPDEATALVEATLAAMDAPEPSPATDTESDTPGTTEAPPKGGATVATSSLQAKLNYLKRRRPS